MNQNISHPSRLYTILCVLFSTLIVVGNLIYQKIVKLNLGFHIFELSVGTILYPLTFMITDLISEFFDKENAKFCVRLAMVINLIVVSIISVMNLLPATEWSKVDNEMFHRIFGAFGISFIASIIASYLSQSIDITLYLWIKKITKDKYLWLRSNVSTSISLFMDTAIVISILTTFNILPREHLFSLIINSYSFKFLFVICSTPLFYLSVTLIKRLSNVQKN